MTASIITVIGAGNMGCSLIHGLIKHGHDKQTLWAADPNPEKLAGLSDIHTTGNNLEAVKCANVIIFAVKPHSFSAVASELKEVIQHNKPLIISIAAGVPIERIQRWLGGNLAIVRAMPNTPALIGCGATALYANEETNTAQRELATQLLNAVGMTLWVETENMINTVTALSGSGPAYFFLMMEAMQEAAESLGMPTDMANKLTLHTALGAARMALETGLTPQALRKQVTSPGGTTEKALLVLEEHNIRNMFNLALAAAEIRAKELAEIK